MKKSLSSVHVREKRHEAVEKGTERMSERRQKRLLHERIAFAFVIIKPG